MTSPARAGSTLLAAKPTAVARNAFANVVVTERLEQSIASAARGSRGSANIVASDKASHSGRARAIVGQHAPQIHVVEEQRDQCDGQRQNDNGADVANASGLECLLLYPLKDAPARYMLLLSARIATL